MATQFEHDMEEPGTTSIFDRMDSAVENDDESDQAKASFCSLSFCKLAKVNKFLKPLAE